MKYIPLKPYMKTLPFITRHDDFDRSNNFLVGRPFFDLRTTNLHACGRIERYTSKNLP